MTSGAPSDREAFYRERNERSEEYLGQPLLLEGAISVEIDSLSANSAPGQLLVLALANQLARLHTNIRFHLASPAAPLLVTVPLAQGTLGEALASTCRAIDPFGSFTAGTYSPGSVAVSVGVGADVRLGLDIYLGAERAVGLLGVDPQSIGTEPGSLRGAALAACLGAAAVLRKALGFDVVPRRLSSWNLREGDDADLGPSDLLPLDVGRVLMVGAGAVGAAAAYWLRAFGVGGDWTVVDGDEVELHNANRGLLFSAKDAGWGGGEKGGALAKKAELVAPYLNGRPVVGWYDEATETQELYDVILTLANERDVRTRIAQRNAAIVMHATTGRNWLSQLHRHILGRDDCVRCRTRDIREVNFACSTGPLEPGAAPEGDAALPFLSAASGLMLVTAMQRLAAGALDADPWNDWRWHFDSPHRMASGGIRRCDGGCSILLPQPVRTMINAASRWGHLIA